MADWFAAIFYYTKILLSFYKTEYIDYTYFKYDMMTLHTDTAYRYDIKLGVSDTVFGLVVAAAVDIVFCN